MASLNFLWTGWKEKNPRASRYFAHNTMLNHRKLMDFFLLFLLNYENSCHLTTLLYPQNAQDSRTLSSLW